MSSSPPWAADRVALAFLCEAYDEEVVDARARTTSAWSCTCIRRWLPSRPPCCPCPRSWADKATEIYDELSKYFMVDYDDAGSIGKRYRRQDEIGTPLLHHRATSRPSATRRPRDDCVTVRDRDTMEQVRMPISELKDYIAKKVAF